MCAPDDGWRYHPKHVEQFPDINKLFNVALFGHILEFIRKSFEKIKISLKYDNNNGYFI